MDIEQAAERIEQMRGEAERMRTRIGVKQQSKAAIVPSDTTEFTVNEEAAIEYGRIQAQRSLENTRPAWRWENSGFSEHLRKQAQSNDLYGDDWHSALKAGWEQVLTGGVFVLLGRWGTGKSQLAACLGLMMCERGLPAKYWRTIDLLGDYKAKVFNGNGSHGEWVAKHAGRGLLVLDEVEKRAGSSFEHTVLSNLIDARHTHTEKPTMLISNLKPTPFSELMRPDVMDRINANGLTIECKWGSYREAK